MNDDAWLRPADVVALTGIPLSTVYRWRGTPGYGPRCYRFGTRKLWRRSDVIQWARDRELIA